MNLSQNHYAQFYQAPAFLIDRIEKYVSLGLTHEAGVIVIAASEHIFLLQKKLEKKFDLGKFSQKGQLLLVDADEALALFMENGKPDPARFEIRIGGMISEISQKFTLARAYGEMVNLLWERENRQGTLELENLWSQLAQKQNFSLMCGYSMKNFARKDFSDDFTTVCNCHSHVYPDETYIAAAGDTDQYRRLIAELQQRNLALQNESSARKNLETELFNLKKKR